MANPQWGVGPDWGVLNFEQTPYVAETNVIAQPPSADVLRAIADEIGDRRGANQHGAKEERQEIGNPRASDFAAKKAGFGNRETFRQAAHVVNNAEPELVEAMDEGKVSILAAHKATVGR